MPTITRASFALVWMTFYASVLQPARGRLVTREGYAAVYDNRPSDLGFPWHAQHWDWFWAYYLGGPDRVRGLSVDAAWERVVPFRWVHGSTVQTAADASTTVEVLIYPASIAVVIRVDADGGWPLDRVGAELSDLRDATDWELVAAGGVSAGRSLDGIATDLRNKAAALLTGDGAPDPGTQQVLTVAAPLMAEAKNPESLDLDDETVKACLAGLANVGPPGKLSADRLLDENRNTKLPARVYDVGDGHAIWAPGHMLAPQQNDPLGCLFSNQTTLVAHISALSALVSWATERIAGGGVPTNLVPVVKLAGFRLEQLAVGDRAKTYRSELAKKRIEPLTNDLKAVAAL